jgi:hypothetical protein
MEHEQIARNVYVLLFAARNQVEPPAFLRGEVTDWNL